MIGKIAKRDGKIVAFDKRKIGFAVLRAAIACGGRDREMADRIADDVVALLEKRGYRDTYPTVEEVQDLVEKCLIEGGHARTAKAYIVYRYEHELKRAGRQSLTYSSENIPYKKLWQALSWSLDHECFSLSQVSSRAAAGRMKELISASEEFYASEVDTAAARITERIEEIKVVIIAGPSASGKTTTTIKIGERIGKTGKRFVPINADNYFFDLATHPRDTEGDYDFETPQSLDLELFNRHLKELLDGRTVRLPFYDFKKGRREGSAGTVTLSKDDIILIDSHHGLFPGMTEGIDEALKFRCYIETLSQVRDRDNHFIRWPDIRMLRRMVRDRQFRNYNPVQTLLHWRFVRRAELRHIVPRLKTAHVIVNSYLPYELPFLKARLKAVLTEGAGGIRDSGNEDAYERLQRIQSLFEELPDTADESLVPEDSLFREFIGGSRYRY